MKTLEYYLEEASEQFDQANDSNADDYYPHSTFLESAIRRYAKDVAQNAIDEVCNICIEHRNEMPHVIQNEVDKFQIVTP